MTASPIQVQILNEGDYQKFRVPSDLGSFGSLTTSAGVLPLQSMSLQGHVVGLLYHLKLVQRFYNPYGQPLEAVYIFPLPGRAAVSSFVMQTEQRRVVGRLEERGEARRQYQQAISQGKQAALAEEERSEVFTMTVGNIPPGQFVEIELELDGPLSWSDGQAMFRFPLVVAPRYIPGTPYSGESVGSGIQADTNAVPDASRISPPVLLPGYPNPVHLSVDIQVDQGGLHFGLPQVSLPDLQCWNEPGGFRLALSPTADRLDRDLIVRIPLPSPQAQSSFQVTQGPEGHYFVLNLVPDDVHQLGPQTPRQVVTLLDRSGSMSGWKMVCARRAVGRLIDSLTERDAFQVLNFDDTVEYLDPTKTSLRYASDRERYLALEQLGKVKDRGGTEILKAIQAGVQMLRGHQQPYLILITDGQVGNESEVLRWIQQNAAGIRIFTVGIDSAVNVSLLERIAQVSGGHFTLVNSEEQLDTEMLGLRRRINPPLLHQVSVQFPGAECSPAQVDLFEGLCSRQMGHVRGGIPLEVDVIGYSSDGRAFRNRLPVTLCSGQTVHKMWARERVLELEHGFLAGWRQPAYQPAAIAQFALLHGVLCRFTAFVAVDDQSYVPGPLHQVTQAVSHPAGWDQQKLQQQSSPRKSGLLRAKSESTTPMFGAAKPTLSPSRMRSQEAEPASFASMAPAGFGGGGAAGGSGGVPSDPFAGTADAFCAPAADPFGAPAASDPFACAPEAEACFEALDCDLLCAENWDLSGAEICELQMAAPTLDMTTPARDIPSAKKYRGELDLKRAPAPPPPPPPSPAPGSGWVPASPPAPGPALDAVQEALQKVRLAQTLADWDAAIQMLIEALVRRGFSLAQLNSLQQFRQLLAGRSGQIVGTKAAVWRQQVETVVNALLTNTPSTRQDTFWM
ncbi:VWA domain-containing protein [bacterium]|nr:VWA domain-containing protein [bacterium]